jgi:acyl-coenzyme A synthetase/AMP-(fatty) acid ligase
MSETEPWSYHADGSPVYSLALARTASGKLQRQVIRASLSSVAVP